VNDGIKIDTESLLAKNLIIQKRYSKAKSREPA